MTAKKLIAIRASELTIRQMEALKAVLGMNQSEVLTLAVDRLYQVEVEQQRGKGTEHEAG